jgi:uncharacterized protein YkwD
VGLLAHPEKEGGMMGIRLLSALLLLFLAVGSAGAQEGRTAEDVRKKLAEILTAPEKQPEGLAGEREAALRRLNAFRYLAGVPHDVFLDGEYNKAAQAAAALCERIGRLDHTPSNPGMPEDEFRYAYRGTSRSNLGQGYRTLTQAIDGWLDDSSEANREIVGHRRWCLNPAMKKAGFGHTGGFTAMYSFDGSRMPVPDFDFVAWPARGPIPVGYFRTGQPWTVSLNPRKYDRPGMAAKPKLWELGPDGKKTGEPLPLDFTRVNTDPFGIPNCISFRPAKLEIAAGKRFLVEIEGVTARAGTKAPAVRFEVEFISEK